MRRLILYSIAFILLLPFMFGRPEDSVGWQQYLLKCTLPAMVVMVFWVNYLWILPDFYASGRKRCLVQRNLMLILLASCIQAGVHHLEFAGREISHHHPHNKEIMHRHGGPRQPHSPMHFLVTAGLRDSLYMMLGIFVAYAILASRRMERLQQQRQEAELARQKAELKGLRNQVSPHFLLNTLNNIYSLSLIDSQRTGDAVMRLSRLLRHTLYDSQEEQVSLVKEAEFIQSYVDLMCLRLTPNVKVTCELQVIPDSTRKVAPLIFISLLENAFKHGTMPAKPCHIAIEMREVPSEAGNGGGIYFRIANSLHPKGESDHSGHGIGLPLVENRLNHYYPNRHTWHYGAEGDEWVAEIQIL